MRFGFDYVFGAVDCRLNGFIVHAVKQVLVWTVIENVLNGAVARGNDLNGRVDLHAAVVPRDLDKVWRGSEWNGELTALHLHFYWIGTRCVGYRCTSRFTFERYRLALLD